MLTCLNSGLRRAEGAGRKGARADQDRDVREWRRRPGQQLDRDGFAGGLWRCSNFNRPLSDPLELCPPRSLTLTAVPDAANDAARVPG